MGVPASIKKELKQALVGRRRSLVVEILRDHAEVLTLAEVGALLAPHAGCPVTIAYLLGWRRDMRRTRRQLPLMMPTEEVELPLRRPIKPEERASEAIIDAVVFALRTSEVPLSREELAGRMQAHLATIDRALYMLADAVESSGVGRARRFWLKPLRERPQKPRPQRTRSVFYING